MIWLRHSSNTSFFFQLPKSAKAEIEDHIWFFQLAKVWLAIQPINLTSLTSVTMDSNKLPQYSQEQTWQAKTSKLGYGGFALEVGEVETYRSYEVFKKAFKEKSQLNLTKLSTGTVELIGTNNNSLKLTLNHKNDLPFVWYDGVAYDWFKHFELYQPTNGMIPITLGWKIGTLRVKADGREFTTTVSGTGKVISETVLNP